MDARKDLVENLVLWLNTQLDTDAEKARAACEYASPDWHLDEEFGETVLWWPPEPHIAEKEREKGLPVVSDRWRGETVGARMAPHIAAWDPARVLREIDTKRRLIEQYVSTVQAVNDLSATRDRLSAAGKDTLMTGLDLESAIHRRDTLRGVLRLVALPYADRPGYEEEWAP